MQTRPGNLVTEAFEQQRDHLRAVAFRMLGSYADAEDVVQEAWMRLARNDDAAIENLSGWLTTVVGRISLDLLRSRGNRPEQSYGDGISEVVIVDDSPEPEECVALADSVGLALLVVLDSLGPSERLAFVLHDMFAVSFAEIGQILGKSADATKMLASRARRKVRATERPADALCEHRTVAREQGTTGGRQRAVTREPQTSAQVHREVVHETRATVREQRAVVREQRAVAQAFRAAAIGGDFEALLRVLDPDVQLTVNAPGGRFVTLGATEVAARAKMFSGEIARHQPVLVGGLPGYISWREDGTPLSLISFTVAHNRIAAVTIVVDPAELELLDLPKWA
ncbi:sigma-70 family RNA polymerase sigma factor [Nocardia sp. ET3-3]|uniref:Sigma-70 family RNA polymerase sigma factor n=1 Tax=Nocardia terrae TaxID=2675851 RepID=A0A7K1V140_9NOCA|nr:sigma-70 family RNA polymerase sigma factor [Nocardia terrae]MVU80305.1 sigma-70 family RNA polymerase sigma factor [Nocardia terrae]